MDKSHYFYRNVTFSRKDNKTSLADIYNPTLTSPLEDWLGTIISLADGQHTVQELLDYLRTHYRGMTPANFENTVESVFDRLIEGKLVLFSEKSVELPYYLAEPIESLDIKKAKKLMHEDGHTQH
ncbi:MAG: hypothetical protein L3J28_06815 [Candidatus Polarisedimenticolaceae bacterium]|nr:hypothetical protein [Candidatus Polarisedimenticolaceae bacterium]